MTETLVNVGNAAQTAGHARWQPVGDERKQELADEFVRFLLADLGDTLRKFTLECARIQSSGTAFDEANRLSAVLLKVLGEYTDCVETMAAYRCPTCDWVSTEEPESVMTEPGRGFSGPVNYSNRTAPEYEWECPCCGGHDIEEVELCQTCEQIAEPGHVCEEVRA